MASRTLFARGLPSASRASAFAQPSRNLSVDASSLKGRHLDNLFLTSAGELAALLRISHGLRKKLTADPSSYRPLVRGPAPRLVFPRRQ